MKAYNLAARKNVKNAVNRIINLNKQITNTLLTMLSTIIIDRYYSQFNFLVRTSTLAAISGSFVILFSIALIP